ncbi:hypothetical protein L208DRAFT_1399691 [Tricholoma matsutake]|nr:hypothetical protein L208DRAFT_1399691 [Tricholoma matsutake 945]
MTLPTPETLLSQQATEMPTFSTAETSTREENPFTQAAPATWVGHIRHTRDLAILLECTCRVAVEQQEIAAGCGVIHCKRPGCET